MHDLTWILGLSVLMALQKHSAWGAHMALPAAAMLALAGLAVAIGWWALPLYSNSLIVRRLGARSAALDIWPPISNDRSVGGYRLYGLVTVPVGRKPQVPELIAVLGLGYVGLPVAVACAGAGARGGLRHRRRPGRGACAQGATRPASSGPRSWPGSTCTTPPTRPTWPAATASSSPCRRRSTPTASPTSARCARLRHVGAGAARRAAWWSFETTVYPGVTEEVCGPVLAAASGLRQGRDFQLGYSPERINPGDREHRLETIVKVVAAEDAAALARLAASTARSSRPGCTAPVDQGRRGRQGDREHPARPQHRADERARADLRPAGHPHPRRAARPRPPSGTSCPSRPAWSAATASASIPIT